MEDLLAEPVVLRMVKSAEYRGKLARREPRLAHEVQWPESESNPDTRIFGRGG